MGERVDGFTSLVRDVLALPCGVVIIDCLRPPSEVGAVTKMDFLRGLDAVGKMDFRF